jgi:hypothetical protein
MQVTNNLDLPPQLVRALMHRDMRYSRGSSRMSVTQLLSSPRQVALQEAHQHEIVEDVSDSIYRLLGSILHKLLELGSTEDDGIIEQRVSTTIDGWEVSGGVDVQVLNKDGREIKIIDWKFTSVLTVTENRPDWAKQLNCYAALLRRAEWRVTGLENIAIIRDWSRARAQMSNKYPQSAVARIVQPLWPEEEADAFLRERVRLHQEAQAIERLGAHLPYCTDEERWNRGDTYALVSPKGRAIKTGDTPEEIVDWIINAPKKYDGKIVRRPGVPTRCMNYCRVAPWCDQWAAENRTKQGRK